MTGNELCLSINTSFQLGTPKKYRGPFRPNYPFNFEQPHKYDWSSRACLVDQQEDRKKACQQTNYLINKWSAISFAYMLSPRLPIGQINKPYLTDHTFEAIDTKLQG